MSAPSVAQARVFPFGGDLHHDRLEPIFQLAARRAPAGIDDAEAVGADLGGVPGALQNLVVGQLRLLLGRAVVMLGLAQNLQSSRAAADLGGDDGAEFHVAAHELDANLVGPVEQIVDVVAADAQSEISASVRSRNSPLEHALGEVGDVRLQIASGRQLASESSTVLNVTC